MSSNVFMNNQLERIADYIDAGKAGGSLTIDVTGAGDMRGATATAAGVHGLVPAPAAGDENKVLSGAGTWIVAGSGRELGDLEDVTITSPTSGESLKYNGAKWVNGNVTAELPDFIDETSGNIVTVNAAERPAKSLVVAINPVQSGSGDPSPENVRPISGWTECNVVVSPTTDAEDGTTYTIHFPSEAGTVYGGTLDVLSGVLTVTNVSVDLGTLNWKKENEHFYSDFINDCIRPSSGSNPNFVCSQYMSASYITVISHRIDYVIGASTSPRLYVFDSRFTDATAFKTAMQGVQLVYPLATPITYQLTPTDVQMLLGTNNIWADTGEVKELKYIPQTYNDLLEEVTGGGVNYSTSEQNTGLKWIDGKSIYQRTVTFTVTGGNVYVSNPTGITGVDNIIDHQGIGRVGDFIITETAYNNPPTNNNSIAILYNLQSNEIYADYRATSEANGATFYITFLYTKI